MTRLEELRYTLMGDGSSDAVLLRHITWLLRQHTQAATRGLWADLSRLPRRPRGLGERIRRAVELYPCDLLFVHRDAERDPREARVAEIRGAVGADPPPHVCVVPVRMTEAWLHFDEGAIRRAAGNPVGHVGLTLPHVNDVEHAPDPKQTLHTALRAASELSGRRRKAFSVAAATHRVGDLIADFAPLRALPAFAALERDLVATLRQLGV